MARFFKFKSVAELLAENERLGIDLRFQDDLSVMNQPLTVGSRTVGNRWAIHPMEGCDGEPDGTPGELTFRRFQRFGSGGAKLIWSEASAVTPEGRANPRQLWLTPRNKSVFVRLVKEAKAFHRVNSGGDGDLLLGLQLTHSGRYSFAAPKIAANDPLLVSQHKVDADTPLISDDELKVLVDRFAASAKLAAEVGFDFVDVKQCHRYLLSELLGARNRPGPYGGSLENRTRLAREIFQAIRAAVPNLMLATRMNLFDGVPFRTNAAGDGEPLDQLASPNGWGMNERDPFTMDLTEPLKWIAEMRSLGVVLLNTTLGNPYVAPHYNRPFETPPPDCYESPEHPLVGVDRHFRAAAAVQSAFPDLAVVGTGYSYLQEFMAHAAAANIAAKRVAIVGVGRASLAQPDWVNQLKENGKLDRRRVCRTFSYCTGLMRAKDHPMGQFPTGCPPFDKEAYGDFWKDVQDLQIKKEPD